jgi:hypothetical protein
MVRTTSLQMVMPYHSPAPGDAALPSLASFWGGQPMPALDQACLLSFAKGGHDVSVYSFDEVERLPSGITVRDAREIAPPESMQAFIFNGRPNLSHFSDYFRYRLFAETRHTWIDTDMFMLRPIAIGSSPNIFAKETDNSLCGAIMRIDATNPKLAELIRRTESLMNKDLVWGATGPRLLSQVFAGEHILSQAHAPDKFFPIHYDDFWKPFLPEYKEECEQSCAGSYTLHLWNNIVVSLGVWKELAPPEGSFLWGRLRALDLIDLFRDTYPADVMRNMISNWTFRQNGAALGIGKLARQVLPSIVRTVSPKMRAILQMHR